MKLIFVILVVVLVFIVGIIIICLLGVVIDCMIEYGSVWVMFD